MGSKKEVVIDGIGPLTIHKRRGAKQLRISLASNGAVRVGIPYWVPYATGIAFAQSRKDWILEQQAQHESPVITNGSRIGKAHRIVAGDVTRIRTTATEIIVPHQLLPIDVDSNARLAAACERALKQESETLLPQRLKTLAQTHGFHYHGSSIKKMRSRWGSCSSERHITLSSYLIQLPWNLIDYVLLHELVHTEHLNHSRSFWTHMESVLPATPRLKKELKQYRTHILPYGPAVA